MSDSNSKKRIDEISMMKGMGILVVVFGHMTCISGLDSSFPGLSKIMTPIETPLMFLFFLLSGYVTSSHKNTLREELMKRVKALLLPYYKFSIAMLVIYGIIYLGLEHKSLDWFIDGALGNLLQLQSFHFFDTEISGVHPMFYGVIVGWFVFQMTVSSFIFIPILRWLQEKQPIAKLISAIALIGTGAFLYVLNLQGLNGKFFPTVCKILILPNIPGIAGVMMLGNWLKNKKFLEFDEISKGRKVGTLLTSFVLLIVLYITDDCLYDFPIGKWGTYGPLAYFMTPIYSIAVVAVLGMLCWRLKLFSHCREFLMYWGDNSMDVFIVHSFFAYLLAYLAGFWVCYLSEVNSFSTTERLLHFILLIIVVPILCQTYIKWKHEKMGKIKGKN